MKVLILSDIHANIQALNAVWEAESDSDAVLCAGDLVDWGFHPAEVISWMRRHNAFAVAGNHDRHICKVIQDMQAGIEPPEGEFAALNAQALSPEDASWLQALPAERTILLDGTAFYMKHAYKEDDRMAVKRRWLEYQSLATFEEIWREKTDDATASKKVILYGHSHQSCLYQVKNGAFFLNPGSLSYRVCDDSREKGADYAVLYDGDIRLRHVDYPTGELLELVEKSPLRDDVKAAARIYLASDLPEKGTT